ncbi:MAG: hypothetical protein NZ928_01740 [Endomicrobia bacterium]|nr:hypothetical protein [Endomicrobiia bacterium]MDW8055147.1 hypothetical protein [Elusimicrobiota bacterium]
MIKNRYFKKIKFTKTQILKYLKNAIKDLNIAKQQKIPEVKFNYSYTALIKSGIALIASVKGLKVRSIPGHHIKILEQTSKILNDENILIIGNSMRMKRNTDLYEGGIFISEKESEEYYSFVEETITKIKKILEKITK